MLHENDNLLKFLAQCITLERGKYYERSDEDVKQFRNKPLEKCHNDDL